MELRRLAVWLVVLVGFGCAHGPRASSEPQVPQFEHVFQKPLPEALAVTRELLAAQGYSFEDTQDPNHFYFATTGYSSDANSAPTRLWALDFVDAARPELGGTVTQLLDGTEGIRSLDNLAVSASGKVVIQEDPGNSPRLAKVWHYDSGTDGLVQIAQHDPARFGSETAAAAAPFTQDEESSGVVDVTGIFGRDGGQAFLLDTQAHYPFGAPGSSGLADVVEGGQLMLMRFDADAAFA